MIHAPDTAPVVVLHVEGELDESAARGIAADLATRSHKPPALIVISLARATGVRWNAACVLGRAVRSWRGADRPVIVRDMRPSLRAVLAHTGVLA